ncbi:MAG: substrate-binding domain-containing protein [Planctomycetota bacterium]
MSRINPLYRLLAVCGVLVVALAALMPRRPPAAPAPGAQSDARSDAGPGAGATLLVYCAASVRQPIDRLAEQYRRRSGVRIDLGYGGSNTLLSQIEVSRQGDLFLAADTTYTTLATRRGLAEPAAPIARMTAVLAVPAGNPLGVRTIGDLATLRVAAGSPDQTAIGRATREALQRAGRWRGFDTLVRRRGVYKPTVADVAGDVARQHPGVVAVEDPLLAGARSEIAVAVLTCSRQVEAARGFARFLAGEAGRRVLEEFGYGGVRRVAGGTRGAKPDGSHSRAAR